MSKESAYTSLNQVPAIFKKYELGRVNLDLGAGKFDKGTDYLAEHGTENLPIDSNHYPPAHNATMMGRALTEKLNSITCCNLLNVLQNKKEREQIYYDIRIILKHQKRIFKNTPIIFFQMFEGDKSGKASETTVQTNMKTAAYIPEIQKEFPEWEVQQEKNVLIV